MKTLAELEIDDELDLNELDLESSAESQSISSTETPNEQTNERKRNVFIIHEFPDLYRILQVHYQFRSK